MMRRAAHYSLIAAIASVVFFGGTGVAQLIFGSCREEMSYCLTNGTNFEDMQCDEPLQRRPECCLELLKVRKCIDVDVLVQENCEDTTERLNASFLGGIVSECADFSECEDVAQTCRRDSDIVAQCGQVNFTIADQDTAKPCCDQYTAVIDCIEEDRDYLVPQTQCREGSFTEYEGNLAEVATLCRGDLNPACSDPIFDCVAGLTDIRPVEDCFNVNAQEHSSACCREGYWELAKNCTSAYEFEAGDKRKCPVSDANQWGERYSELLQTCSSTASTSPIPTNQMEESSSSDVGRTVGIVFGIILILVVIGGILYLFLRRRQQRTAQQGGIYAGGQNAGYGAQTSGTGVGESYVPAEFDR